MAEARAAVRALALLSLALWSAGAWSQALIDTIARIKPSIVAVGTVLPTRSPAFLFRGTGFVVGDGSIVATNAHVISDKVDADKLETLVAIAGGVEQHARPVKLLAIDEDHDIALLRLTGEPLPALALGESSGVREGQMLAFTGYPIGAVLGLKPVTHRAMIASITPIARPMAQARQLDPKVLRRLSERPYPVFQLDATAYPGNSGSPLFDPDSGAVLGIINMVLVKGSKETALSSPSGISYAIPAQHLAELLDKAR